MTILNEPSGGGGDEKQTVNRTRTETTVVSRLQTRDGRNDPGDDGSNPGGNPVDC